MLNLFKKIASFRSKESKSTIDIALLLCSKSYDLLYKITNGDFICLNGKYFATIPTNIYNKFKLVIKCLEIKE